MFSGLFSLLFFLDHGLQYPNATSGVWGHQKAVPQSDGCKAEDIRVDNGDTSMWDALKQEGSYKKKGWRETPRTGYKWFFVYVSKIKTQ